MGDNLKPCPFCGGPAERVDTRELEVERAVAPFVRRITALTVEKARMEATLHRIIALDHHNMGPESRATKIARAGLPEDQR